MNILPYRYYTPFEIEQAALRLNRGQPIDPELAMAAFERVVDESQIELLEMQETIDAEKAARDEAELERTAVTEELSATKEKLAALQAVKEQVIAFAAELTGEVA